MARYRWNDDDERRDYDRGEQDARWGGRADYSRSRYDDGNEAYFDGYDNRVREERERRREEVAEEHARKEAAYRAAEERRQWDEQQYDQYFEQQQYPEPEREDLAGSVEEKPC